MPDWLKFPLVLVIVALISAASLAYLETRTEPARMAEAEAVKNSALEVVLPGASKFGAKEAEVDGKPFEYYEAYNNDGEIVGYSVTGSSYGYSSNLVVMAGVDKDFKIVAIKVLSQKETPGLGDKVEEILSKKTIVGLISGKKYNEGNLRPWFQIQFDGKSAPVKVQKDGGQIEAITGATISSRAVCSAVNSAVDSLKKALIFSN